MALTLKQQMVKKYAQEIVRQPNKFPSKTVKAAEWFLDVIDIYATHSISRWENHSTSWREFRPLLEKALPEILGGV